MATRCGAHTVQRTSTPSIHASGWRPLHAFWRRGAAPPIRSEGRLGREGPTRHEASSPPHEQSPEAGEAPSSVARPVGGFRAGARGQRQRERRVLDAQEAETATGRMRREAHPRADATSTCETEANTHQESSGRDKQRQKMLNRACPLRPYRREKGDKTLLGTSPTTQGETRARNLVCYASHSQLFPTARHG